MMIEMTPEQVAQSEALLLVLRASTKDVDQIKAIIMDPTIGGSGLYENAATAKAIEILQVLKTEKQRRSGETKSFTVITAVAK